MRISDWSSDVALPISPLKPISQNALRYYNDVAYDGSYNGLARDLEEGARMARALGAKRVLFLANHGVVVVGPNIARPFEDRKSVVSGTSVSVRVDLGGRRIMKKQQHHHNDDNS